MESRVKVLLASAAITLLFALIIVTTEVEAQGFGRPGFGSGFGRPGFGSGFGRPGFGSGFGRPGFGSGFGRPGFGSGFGRPGFGSGFGRPGFGSGFGRPGFGSGFGRPGFGSGFGRPGFGSGFGRPGFSSGLNTFNTFAVSADDIDDLDIFDSNLEQASNEPEQLGVADDNVGEMDMLAEDPDLYDYDSEQDIMQKEKDEEGPGAPPVPPETCEDRQFFCQIYKHCYPCFADQSLPQCSQCEKILTCEPDDKQCQQRETCKLCSGMSAENKAKMPVCRLSECK